MATIATMQPVDANELLAVEGGQSIGIFTGNLGKVIALQKNGADVGAPEYGAPDSYKPGGGAGLQRGDGYGDRYGVAG